MDMNLLTILCLDSGIDFRLEQKKSYIANKTLYTLTLSSPNYARRYQVRDIDMDRLMERVEFEFECIWHKLFVPSSIQTTGSEE